MYYYGRARRYFIAATIIMQLCAPYLVGVQAAGILPLTDEGDCFAPGYSPRDTADEPFYVRTVTEEDRCMTQDGDLIVGISPGTCETSAGTIRSVVLCVYTLECDTRNDSGLCAALEVGVPTGDSRYCEVVDARLPSKDANAYELLHYECGLNGSTKPSTEHSAMSAAGRPSRCAYDILALYLRRH